MYTTKDISIIALSSAFWAALNITISPIFWHLTHLPFFCDFLAILSLATSAWYIRKLGVAASVGIITTLLSFIFRPGSFYFIGFTIASILFDVFAYVLKFKLDEFYYIPLLLISFISTFTAGIIIGYFFMAGHVPLLYFALLHSTGGVIGAFLGIPFINGIKRRKIREVYGH